MTDDCTNEELIDLTGRRALVTGAAKGIGAAIAVRLADAGAHVTVADLDDQTGRATADELTARGLSDAQIQLISGHESKKSLEVYQHLSLENVERAYQDAVASIGV